MEQIALYIIENKEDLFVERARINCTVDKFCACDNAYELFGIGEVMQRKLVDVGEGVKVSEPVEVERGLRSEGKWFFASLSHRGVLAICSCLEDNDGNETYTLQLTGLGTDRRVEMEVENCTSVAFYDDKMILLTEGRPLREGNVEDVFGECNLTQLRRVGEECVYPSADVSLLNETRVLYYRTTDKRPFFLDVDTREGREIVLGKKVWSCASLTGVNCGVRVVFQDYLSGITYTLHKDNSVGVLGGKQMGGLTVLFPSSTDPTDLGKAVPKYRDYLVCGGKGVEVRRPLWFEADRSIVRIYRDIFLLYNVNTRSWVLARIIIP